MTPAPAIRILSSCLLVFSVLLFASGQSRPALPGAAEKSLAPPAIILGFTGGFIRHDDVVHGEVQLASRLRKEYSTGTIVETFENHSGDNAYKSIVALLDVNHDGSLTDEEKRNARIVLYGHSWGGSEAVAVARRLEKDVIPVLLTVQVDSVQKIGENDEIIPANVAQAANFYQSDGLLHGETEIRAADKTHTKIIGNFQFHYDEVPYNCVNYPWYARFFMKPHIQIECDSKVWDRVDALIRSSLPEAKASGSALSSWKPFV